MRLLHTGDWHIGKRLYGADRLAEFTAVADEIATVAADEAVDVILMSGDILDRRLVDPLVLSTCLQAFERLAAVAPVVAITGNHDEPLFWAEIAPYLAPRILLAASDAVFGLDTGAGRITVACMPWPEPAQAPAEPGASRATGRVLYADSVRERLAALAEQGRTGRRERGGALVLLAHALVRGGVSGGGERELSLAGTYNVDADAFADDFDYVALGHLHRAQTIAAIPSLGRYCGSPLALDFSGDGEHPSVTVVDLDDGIAQARDVGLTTGRRLVRLRGNLAELTRLAAEHADAWFFCEVVDEPSRLDLVRAVRERVPHALRVEQVGAPVEQLAADDPSDAGGGSLTDLYRQWLVSGGRSADERLVAAFGSALNDADG